MKANAIGAANEIGVESEQQLRGTKSGSMNKNSGDGKRHLRKLAEMLQLTVVKKGSLFTLSRTADVSAPVHHEGLSLAEAEEVLNIWKLRGPHGG